MGGTLRVFTIGRIPVYVHTSWLLIYALITWSLAVGYLPQAIPDRPAASYWLTGLLAALLLFVSVLLHELSHSFVAQAAGLRVRGVTLHVFGGVSQLEDEAPGPRAEFLIAIVGPVTSLGLAGAIWLVNAAGGLRGGPAGAIGAYLVVVNVALGLFNLVPGFPLDGGRILRSALWWWNGSLRRATYGASRVGVVVAFGLMAVGALQMFGGALVSGLWLVLIGLFLRDAADASWGQLAVRRTLNRLRVRDLMTTGVVTIGADADVAELVDRFWAHHFTSFPVVDGGGVRGIASLQMVHDVSRERWSQTRVRDIMRPLTDELVAQPNDSAYDALEKASGNALGRLVVLDGGALAGYVALKDITHVLALRGLTSVDVRTGRRARTTPIRRAA